MSLMSVEVGGRTMLASGVPDAEKVLHFTASGAKEHTLDAKTKYIKLQYDPGASMVTWDRYGGTAAAPSADDATNPITMWPAASGDGAEDIRDRAGSTISIFCDAANDVSVLEFFS